MKNTKKKAVEMLKAFGFKASHNEETNEIEIESNLIVPVSISNEYFGDDKKLVLGFASKYKPLAEQKKVFAEINNAILALEEVKRIDPDLVR